VRRYPKQGIVVDRPIRRKDCTSKKGAPPKASPFPAAHPPLLVTIRRSSFLHLLASTFITGASRRSPHQAADLPSIVDATLPLEVANRINSSAFVYDSCCSVRDVRR
jgi:hypothetical protein